MAISGFRGFAWVVILVGGNAASAAGFQTAAQAAAKHSCTVDHAPPSEADKALQERRYDDAEKLYSDVLKASPGSGKAMAGLVRVTLNQGKLADALAQAMKFAKDHPEDAQVQDALGEVRYRRGEVEEATLAYARSLALDPCAARTRYDVSRYKNLNGLYASAQKDLDTAHALAPDDKTIARAWQNTQHTPLTPDEQIAGLKRQKEDPKLTDEQKAAIESAITAVRSQEKGDCQLAQPVETAKVTMWPSNSMNSPSYPPTQSGIDVYINGKRRRFIVDTGASGLVLSKDAAKSMGLTPEAEVKSGGIGDGGLMGTYLAHVDSVKIGGMEFHNCMVHVLESKTMQWTDGLLGPDVFRSFLVTLDFPVGELRLSPLPARPDETAVAATLGTGGEQEEGTGEGLTIAQAKKDRYIAPQMKNWTPVFRSGHHLIFPTVLGTNATTKLFIMDTGAGTNLVSIDAAREVTHVSFDSDNKVKGVSGDVKHVAGTDSLMIQFAHVRQQIPDGALAIDTSSISRGSGVEISGFIGYPILKELLIQIDYRDNLVNVTYTPHMEPKAR
jgi:Flp pilus assembly protein TadD/predicted aspartyl protease